jgi:hypothetical protein
MKLLQFTQPDGDFVYLSIDAIVRVKPAGANHHQHAKTVIDTSVGSQAVQEPINTVLEMIAYAVGARVEWQGDD